MIVLVLSYNIWPFYLLLSSFFFLCLVRGDWEHAFPCSISVCPVEYRRKCTSWEGWRPRDGRSSGSGMYIACHHHLDSPKFYWSRVRKGKWEGSGWRWGHDSLRVCVVPVRSAVVDLGLACPEWFFLLCGSVWSTACLRGSCVNSVRRNENHTKFQRDNKGGLPDYAVTCSKLQRS